ncbi:MAG: ABC transporter transmembrane domain-containing protein [Sandaracinaceae bacterium]
MPGASLARYVRPYRRQLALGIVFLLLTNAAEKAIPWLLALALDALRAADLEATRDDALIVIGLAAVMWGVRTASRVWIFNVGRDVEYDVRNDVLQRIHVLGPSFFRRMATGEIMSRATNDVAQIRALVGFAGLNVVNSVVAFVSAIALMLAISPKLTLFALLPFPLLVLITRGFARSMYAKSRASQEALAKLSDRATENVAGIRLVRAMALEETERVRFEEANQGAVETTMALVTLRGLMWPVLMGVGSIGTLLVVWIGGGMVLDGTLTPGEFAAFHAYLALLIWPTLALGYILSVVQRGRASFDRLKEILDADPDVRQPELARAPDGPGALEVDGLSFAHGDRKVLDDVTLSVPAGGSLAVLGPTGSGKSTLAALLPRLLPTPAGAVRLDGVDVTELDLRSSAPRSATPSKNPFSLHHDRAEPEARPRRPGRASDAEERIRHAARRPACSPRSRG